MAERLSKKVYKKQSEPFIDLTSLMDIFSNILMFIIVSSVFLKVSTIDINLPRPSAPQPARQDKDEIKILSLKISDSGLKLSGNLGKKFPFIPLVNGDFNYPKLVENLTEIKEDHPEHSDIILLFKDNIPYEDIIGVIDATRELVATENGERV
ncbi:MAG: ExbD/TolR family protein, partial [Nitrospinota bacterium]